MIQMSVSDQIIAVLNDLCAKFGLAIDWSSENILPYLQDICSRLIRYEVFTSIAWCGISLCILAVFKFMWGTFDTRYKKELEDGHDTDYNCGAAIFQLFFWIWLFISIIIIAVQIFDMIACGTIPEKIIIDYVSGLLTKE